MTAKSPSICLVGAGNMGGAMLSGWLDNGVDPNSIIVIDPGPPPAMQELLASRSVPHAIAVPDGYSADIVIVAVKPQIMDLVLPGLLSLVSDTSVFVSVAAGKTIASMTSILGDCPVIRAMPNTPAQVQRGITVCVANGKVTQQQKDNVGKLLTAIGEVAWVEDEAQMDAVTAVSGSGPAYAFHLTEALANAGENAGLPRELAQQLALATVAGAGELMRQSDIDPAQLRKNVTSPNGTTAAALDVLMGEGGFTSLLDRAVQAAKKRSEQLAKG